MFVVLNWKALEAALVEMPASGGIVVRVVPHRVSASDPLAKPTHFTIDQRAKNQMPMVRHQLIRVKFNSIQPQCLMQHIFKSEEVAFLLKNRCVHVCAV